MELKALDKLERLHKKSGKSRSFIVNKAVEAYKRTEVEDYREKKMELARKLHCMQEQMKVLENAEKVAIESKEMR